MGRSSLASQAANWMQFFMDGGRGIWASGWSGLMAATCGRMETVKEDGDSAAMPSCRVCWERIIEGEDTPLLWVPTKSWEGGNVEAPPGEGRSPDGIARRGLWEIGFPVQRAFLTL